MADIIKTIELSWLDLEYLLFHLSDADRRDLFGQSYTENVLEIAHGIINANKGLGWSVRLNGRPAAALGVFEQRRGVWQIWSIGTHNPAVAFALLHPLFEQIIPHIRSHGGHRIECRTRYEHNSNRSHLQLLGFRPEAVLRQYGTDRSHYLQYVYFMLDDEQPISKPVPVPVRVPDGPQPTPAALN